MGLVVLFCSQSKLRRPWYDANDTAENNEKARRIYESVMTITLRKPDSERYRNFSREVKRIAKQEYNDSSYDDDDDDEVRNGSIDVHLSTNVMFKGFSGRSYQSGG